MSEWQPIETAPTHEYIIGWGPRWFEPRQMKAEFFTPEGLPRWETLTGAAPGPTRPTHWMRFAAPPKQSNDHPLTNQTDD